MIFSNIGKAWLIKIFSFWKIFNLISLNQWFSGIFLTSILGNLFSFYRFLSGRRRSRHPTTLYLVYLLVFLCHPFTSARQISDWLPSDFSLCPQYHPWGFCFPSHPSSLCVQAIAAVFSWFWISVFFLSSFTFRLLLLLVFFSSHA